jgi:hypothetical protein
MAASPARDTTSPVSMGLLSAESDEPSRIGSAMQFVTPEPNWALLRIDGHIMQQWRCCGHELPDGHLIAVTRGPVDEAVDERGTFKQTFERPSMPPGEMRARFATPSPPFRLLAVRDLVPPCQRAAYDEIVNAEARGLPLATPSRRPAYNPPSPPPVPAQTSEGQQRQDFGNSAPGWFNSANSSGAYDALGCSFDPFGGAAAKPEHAESKRFSSDASRVPDDECVIL